MIPPKHNFCVLYVEDEENDVFLLQHAWHDAFIDLPLRVAQNGKEALDYFQGTERLKDPFPICGMVLLDLNLPIVSGFEVLSWIRAQPHFRRLPVLILTSSNQNRDIQLAYEMGANAFLIKPSNFERLIQLLRSLKEFWLLHNTFPHFEP